MDLNAPGTVDGPLATLAREHVDRADPPLSARHAGRRDPAELAQSARRLRLASSPPCNTCLARQRAVLILREVLRWKAKRGRRAARHERRVRQQRAAVGACDDRVKRRRRPRGPAAGRYRRGPTRRCSGATSRPSSDTTGRARRPAARGGRRMSMPPYELWLRGPARPARVARVSAPAAAARGSCRWQANGKGGRSGSTARAPAVAGSRGALQVIEHLRWPRSSRPNAFLDTDRLFPLFGLPAGSTRRPRGPRPRAWARPANARNFVRLPRDTWRRRIRPPRRARGELQARQRIDRDGARREAADVAETTAASDCMSTRCSCTQSRETSAWPIGPAITRMPVLGEMAATAARLVGPPGSAVVVSVQTAAAATAHGPAPSSRR